MVDFDFDGANSDVPEENRPVFLQDVVEVDDAQMRFRIRGGGLYLGEMGFGETLPTSDFRVLLGNDNDGNPISLIYAPDAAPAEGCGGEDGLITRVGWFTWEVTADTACLVKRVGDLPPLTYPVHMPFTMQLVDERHVRWIKETQP